jgi:site-specific DNA recombinase
MKKVALYTRVSTQDQAEEGYSIGEQEARLLSYCEARGWRASNTYTDAGFSGGNIDRPGISALVQDIERYDIVLVYKLDRLSRSQKDTLHLIEDVFLPAGTDLISITENFDTSTPFGKAMIGILSVFAQLERDQIKERMSMGKLGRAKAGKPSSWKHNPIGYTYSKEIDTYVVNPVTAPIVQDIFASYLAGEAITAMCDRLNADGHIGKQKPWRHSSIGRVLKNPVYMGLIRYDGKTYDGTHDPLVSPEDFAKTQDEITRRQEEAYERSNLSTTRPFQSKYLLSGILRCGHCGASLMLVQAGSKRKDGTRRKSYKCVTRTSVRNTPTCYRNPDGCQGDGRLYLMEDLEDMVLGEIEKLRLDKSGMEQRPDAHDTQKDIEALHGRISQLDAALGRMVALYAQGNIEIDILDREREKMEQERKTLAKRLGKMKSTQPGMKRDEAREILDALPADIRSLEYEEQKRIVRALIEKITLTGDKMVIRWRFSDNRNI